MLGLVLLGACDYPMSASDGISRVAGQAPRANARVQTIDPNAGHHATPNPGGDGQRAARVIERYRSAESGMDQGDTASAGESGGGDGAGD
jgi:hypothetical protein